MASLQQRTPAWHAARQGKLTASNIGAVLGLCPWTSRQEAYNRAVGLSTFVANDACTWGTKNEANGILAYTAHTGNLVDNTGLHVHPDQQWLAGSPDGLIGETGLLEVKCPYYYKKDGSRVHKEVPAHYYMQMNLCLECADRDWCDFISWSPQGYKIYRVTRDTGLHEAMMPHYVNFFATIQRATKPARLSAEDKESIADAVQRSMQAHISYTFWDNMDVNDTPPEPMEDEESEPPVKRAKLNLTDEEAGHAPGA